MTLLQQTTEFAPQFLQTLYLIGSKQIPPAEARKMVEAIHPNHFQNELHLVWERAYPTYHYEMLVSNDEEGTISLSYCPPNHQPWAVRNASHPRDDDFVVINNFLMSVSDIMNLLDRYLYNEHIVDAILTEGLLKSKYARLNPEERISNEPTPQMVQESFEAWRHQKGLQTSDQYYQWLQTHGKTHEEIENQLKNQLRLDLFVEKIGFAGTENAQEYFKQNKALFTRYVFETFVVESAQEAYEFLSEVTSGTGSFRDLAIQKFLASGANGVPYQIIESVAKNLRLDVQAQLGESPEKSLFGPFPQNGRWIIMHLLQSKPATFSADIAREVRTDLIKTWVKKELASAQVQWLWGDQRYFENRNICNLHNQPATSTPPIQ